MGEMFLLAQFKTCQSHQIKLQLTADTFRAARLLLLQRGGLDYQAEEPESWGWVWFGSPAWQFPSWDAVRFRGQMVWSVHKFQQKNFQNMRILQFPGSTNPCSKCSLPFFLLVNTFGSRLVFYSTELFLSVSTSDVEISEVKYCGSCPDWVSGFLFLLQRALTQGVRATCWEPELLP